MALAGTTIWEVETGGDDTNNGGAFDPGQTAGMFTDGAATVANTASPVFTSASYNFVAGDVGAWVFIGAGTNWTKGWYKIASVASNAATLSAAVGAAVQSSGATTSPIIPSTVIGCATTASPTGATWSIDYSQQTAAAFTYTDLASAGTGLTVSSAAKPFGKQQVGNCIVITGGTNFNAGRYVIASVAAVTFVATVVGPTNITTGAGASGTGSLGGALASAGIVGGVMTGNNQVFLPTGTYTVTSASTNIAGGCWAPSVSNVTIEGYATVRGDLLPIGASGTRPTIIASGISTFTLLAPAGGLGTNVRNVIVDGASLTSSRGVTGNGVTCYNVHGQNFTNSAFSTSSISTIRCSATGCSTQPAFANSGSNNFSVAYSNTVAGFNSSSSYNFCIAYANSGATSDGFLSNGSGATFVSCTAYNNGRDGISAGGSQGVSLHNCVSTGNGQYGFNLGAAQGLVLVNCAAFNNTSGNVLSTSALHTSNVGFITLTASPFTTPGSGDFSLNTTAGGGTALRAAGYPGVFPVGLTTGYLDVGAAQHADPVAGGSAVSIFGG